jgi:hypothetical protein
MCDIGTMNQRFFLCSITISSSLVAAMIAACGGSNATGDAGPDATTNDASGDVNVADAGNDTATNDASDGGSETGNDASSCDGGCYACCAEGDPTAAEKLFEGARACGCTTPGDCKTTCAASLCATIPKDPDKACIECLLAMDAGNCGEVAATSCADAGCTAVAECMEMCPP